MNKLPFAMAVGATMGGAGYVLGARAGRERYETLLAEARHIAEVPLVHDTARQVAERVREQAPAMKDKLVHAADAAVHPTSHGGPPPDVY